jgi:dihydroflavonol-4-reductase
MSGQLVLVTGGTGYIASYCIKELLQRGYRVRTTVRDLASKKCDILKSGCEVEGQEGKIEMVVANLQSDDGWTEAAAGCDFVLHTASPIGKVFNQSKKKDAEAIKAAKEGTLRAVRAAAASGTCKRVVVTSSIAAVQPPGLGLPKEKGKLLTEEDYADDGGNPKTIKKLAMNPYQKSKILAERAAWEFCAANNLEMATVHPSYTIGPSMSAVNRSESMDIIDAVFLKKEKGGPGKNQPGLWAVPFPVVDVRDVAKIHVEAMTRPAAKGRRYIAHNKTELQTTLAGYLAEDYPVDSGKQNGSVKCCADCCACCCCSCCCIPQMQMAIIWLRKTWKDSSETLDNGRSIKDLEIRYTPVAQTLKDHGNSWRDHGVELAPWAAGKGGKVVPQAGKMAR